MGQQNNINLLSIAHYHDILQTVMHLVFASQGLTENAVQTKDVNWKVKNQTALHSNMWALLARITVSLIQSALVLLGN